MKRETNDSDAQIASLGSLNENAATQTSANTSELSDTENTDSSNENSAAAAQQQIEVDSAQSYNEGVSLAASAQALGQSAFSPDDWGLIVSRWQRAAEQMAQVAPGTENYEAAQAKLADYGRQAEVAQARLAELQTVTYVPLPAGSRAAHPSVAPQPTAPSSNTASANVDTSERRVRVPIVRRLHGTPVVRVTFNGVREYDMILDTGASRTLITRTMADELGVVTIDRMVASTASAAQVTFEVGELSSMSLGSIRLNNARVSIGESVDVGLLGNDFLRGYDVNIMSSEGVVELVAN